MTDIVGAVAPDAKSISSPVSKTSSPALTSDFETFLNMLTTQARNQDPLEPISSSDYAAQLAQFSMVEQQVKTNEALTELVAKLNQPGFSELAGWVGLGVSAIAPANFQGEPVTISGLPVAEAGTATLKVIDSSGTVVNRIELAGSDQPVVWTGQDSKGATVPFGFYTFAIESNIDGTPVADSQAAILEKVSEAQISNGEIVLVLSGGQKISPLDVAAVRAES